jgi:hypothetical protein
LHERARIGVVGCGLISQVMHLSYLSELADRFEVAAVCDPSPQVAAACAERYSVEHVYDRWQDLLAATLESPFRPYVEQHPLVRGDSPPTELIAELEQAEARVVASALGDADEQTLWCYRWILLDSLVHE